MKYGQKRHRGHVVEMGIDDEHLHTDWMGLNHFFIVQFVPFPKDYVSYTTCVRVYHNIERLKDHDYLMDEWVEVIATRVGFWDYLEAFRLDSIRVGRPDAD